MPDSMALIITGPGSTHDPFQPSVQYQGTQLFRVRWISNGRIGNRPIVRSWPASWPILTGQTILVPVMRPIVARFASPGRGQSDHSRGRTVGGGKPVPQCHQRWPGPREKHDTGMDSGDHGREDQTDQRACPNPDQRQKGARGDQTGAAGAGLPGPRRPAPDSLGTQHLPLHHHGKACHADDGPSHASKSLHLSGHRSGPQATSTRRPVVGAADVQRAVMVDRHDHGRASVRRTPPRPAIAGSRCHDAGSTDFRPRHRPPFSHSRTPWNTT